MAEFIRNGVPGALARDAWWLSPPDAGQGSSSAVRRLPLVWPIAAILVAADVTVWQGGGALPIALLTLVYLVAMITAHQPSKRSRNLAVLCAVLSILPVVSFVQSLAVLFWLFGFVAIACCTTGWGLDRLGSFSIRFCGAGVFPFLKAAQWDGTRARRGVRRLMQDWGVAVVLGVVFATLFLMSNPIVGNGFAEFLNHWATTDDLFVRTLFWLLVGTLALCAITTKLLAKPSQTPKPQKILLPPIAVRNALLVFNGMFALQLITDSATLLTDHPLPAGMTLAEFAHRGAYPLVVTAVLAGMFMLVARPHRNFALIKPLLVVWVVQNVVLVGSAALRLSIYVDAFGWTYLRLHSFVWMALVASGLGLVAYDLWKRQRDGWVVLWSIRMGFTTLYAGCFINFGQFIATANIERFQAGQELDWQYLCEMGVSAQSAVARIDHTKCDKFYFAFDPEPAPTHWRDWDFRRWRINGTLVETSNGTAP